MRGRLARLAKLARVAGYVCSLTLLAAAVYWFTIPGGWPVGVTLLAVSLFVAFETRRALKT